MKIGIDARLYPEPSGIGRYIQNLIKNLEIIDKENDYIIFTTNKGSEMYHPSNEKFKKWIVEAPIYSLTEQTSLMFEFSRAKVDVLHIPHFNAPVFYPFKTILTIHDLTMHSNSQEASNNSSGGFQTKMAGYKVVTKLGAKHAKRILVPSQAVKDELIQKLDVKNPDKIVVTYEGVDDKLLQYKTNNENVMSRRFEEMKIKGPFMLYVGNAYPHKNLNTLIVTFKDLLDKTDINLQLVIAGKIDKFTERLAAFIHALNLDDKVIFAARYAEPGTNFVSDYDLGLLYSGAAFYIFPSLKEGFSITPLEAQSFGLPVLLSDIPTHREIFGESVMYFKPESPVDLSEKIAEMIKNKDLYGKLQNLGVQNVKKYSWRKMAEITLNTYKDITA